MKNWGHTSQFQSISIDLKAHNSFSGGQWHFYAEICHDLALICYGIF